MFRFLVPFVLLLFVFQACAEDTTVLLMIPHLYGANYNFNCDQLQQLGFRLTTAGITSTVTPCYSGLPPLQTDTLISQVTDVTQFDAVAIMSSRWNGVTSPYNDLIQSTEALDIIATADQQNIPVWATCAGPLVLAEANVLNGIDMQGRAGPDSSFIAVYLAAGANYVGFQLLPIQDGSIITTSRGQYYQRENCQAILTAVSAVPPLETRAGDCSQGARDITVTSEGNFVLTGYDFSNSGSRSDVLIEMYDEQLSRLWSVTEGGAGYQYGSSVIQTADGGLIICGFTTENGSEDFMLLSADINGSIGWTRTFGGDSLDIATSVCEAPNGDLYICGYTQENTAGESDILLIRTDSQGSQLWEKRFGGAGPETADMVQIREDGNLLITGSTGSFTTNCDAYSVVTDPDGNLIWEQYYTEGGGEGGYDRANAAAETAEGNIAITGDTNAPDLCGIYFLLTDGSGTRLTKRFLGGNFYDHGMDIIQTADGGFLIIGATKDRYTCDNDLYVVKLNEDGQVVWSQEYGEEDRDEWGSSIVPDGNGGYIAAGQRETEEGDFDVYLVPIEDPQQGTGPNLQGTLSISPNPASGYLLVETPEGNLPYSIFDAAGRAVAQGLTSGQVPLANLPSGIYSISVNGNGSVTSKRFVHIR